MDTNVKSGGRTGRPNYPIEFKRRLATAACEPGVSVSKLALEHQVNTNMLFKWRRDLRAGLLDAGPPEEAAFLPVKLLRTATSKAPVALRAPSTPSAHNPCMIEIAIADAIVRVRGDIDAALLRTVLESLRS